MSCYVGLILTPSPCHTLSRISGPPKVRHTSLTSQFLVVHAYIHVFTGRFVLVYGGFYLGGFVRAFLSERFCPRWFLSVPLLSGYIQYNRKLKSLSILGFICMKF